MFESEPTTRPLLELLEHRRLLASAGQLLAYDFNGGAAWPLSGSVSSAGAAAATAQAAVGTIDTEGGITPTGGMNLTTTPPASGAWQSEFTSGRLALANTETNLGKLTLGFSLSASQAKPVTVRVVSYDAAGQETGALVTQVVPAAAGSYQRYAVDLSTMKPSGTGTFNPTAPRVSFNFEVGSASGWSAAGTPTLEVDNVSYSKPALYVSSIDGNNNDNGTTEALAFATIQKAIDASQPGDIILLKGDASRPYTVGAGNRNLITKGGTPAAWVTIKNYPGQSPMIYTEGWAAIQVGAFSASTAPAIGYVEIRGLHVKGGSAKVGSRTAPDGNYDPDAPNANQYGPYASLLQDVDPVTGRNTSGSADSRTNGNGISVDGGKELNKPHDIRIADNLVEQAAGGGIGAGDADRIQFENNVARDNCYWDKYATSGFSILSTYSFDGTSDTVSRLIRNNVSSGNIHKMKWVRNDPELTQYSDGNGIIIDINYDAENVVTGRTLVTNNVVFDNGGSGIHAYKADHVDIVNNTAYLNSASPYLQYGQIYANQSKDVRILNNILVAPVAASGQPKEPVSGDTKPNAANKIIFKNNVYFGGNTPGWAADAYNVGNTTADPKFVNAAASDFRLRFGSPAINFGAAAEAPAVDQANAPRVGLPDAGALEADVTAPALSSVASRKTHGTAGAFDRALNLSGTSTVEPRQGGAATLVFTLGEAVRPADGTLSANEFALTNAAFASATLSGVTVTLNLTGVADRSYVTASLQGLTDASGNAIAGDRDVTVANLYGDVNGTKFVAASDLQTVKNNLNKPLNLASFLCDLNLNGLVTASDLQVVKNNLQRSV